MLETKNKLLSSFIINLLDYKKTIFCLMFKLRFYGTGTTEQFKARKVKKNDGGESLVLLHHPTCNQMNTLL